MMWSLATITEEGLSEEERDRVKVAIEGVVMRIPAELACQIILISSSQIEPVLQNFLSIGNLADSMTKLFLDSRMEVIREAAKNGFPGSGGDPAKDTLDLLHHSLLSRLAEAWACRLCFVGPGSTGSFEEFLRDLLQEGKREIRPARPFRRGHTCGAGFGPKPVSPQELIAVLYPILNPIRATKLGEPVYYPRRALRTGCPFHYERAAAGTKMRGSRTRASPRNISGSHLSRHDPRTSFRMNGNYLMTINFHVPSKEKEMQFYKLKGALAFTHRFNILGDISIESQPVKETSMRPPSGCLPEQPAPSSLTFISRAREKQRSLNRG